VESIASSSSITDVDFSPLRESIHSLKEASAALDTEKHDAEKQLKKIIKKIVGRKILRRKVHKAVCKVKKVFGHECDGHKGGFRAHGMQDINVPSLPAEQGRNMQPRVGHAPVWVKDAHDAHHRGAGGCHIRKDHNKHHKALKKAVKRVRKVNQKLVAFERGFISKEGIKDREWYKHLAVAPGKWLGGSNFFHSTSLGLF
jgi:N-acetylated-alpha-linked acidic dipeptidase